MDTDSLAQIRQIVTEASQGLREEMGGLRTELRQEMAAMTATLREDIADAKRHSGILVEDLHHKLDLVIEGQQFQRQQLVDIRSEIHLESRDTRAMLQLSYHQLQERVESLERRLQTVEQHLGLST
ncbi:MULTISPECIES: hypothetical protein [Nitrospira]|uniref:Uncharacterized protein n=2 Tax=Nitrospira TaxID=1234 RepID=A0AA86MZ28_9BACT|nr:MULTISPECIES: hypothetical protein [Nitrospira]CAE6732959.1 conserved hypothetical protein [Nitrospira defluvii]CAI4031689.1 hypothetical protein DNFV4_02108 [Nitrospira tepida]